MSQRLSVISTHTNTVNGQVITDKSVTKTIVRMADPEPKYVKCYLHDISILHRVQRFTETIMWEMLRLMDYNNEIALPGERKKEICRKLELYKTDPSKGLIPNTNIIDQHIIKLIKAGLFYKKGVGVFVANSNFFGKGKWEDIKNISMTIGYNENGREINTEIEK